MVTTILDCRMTEASPVRTALGSTSRQRPGESMHQPAFTEFDPLEFKVAKQSDPAIQAVKREIRNILSSYVGWFDPFCELIQNALDAVEQRYADEKLSNSLTTYAPTIRVIIDIQNNSLTVSDNGIGLNRDQFSQFLAPNFSFKSGGKTRGHKGVGATYVAYGFNYLQVATRTAQFSAVGTISGARKWLDDSAPSGNPKVAPDTSPVRDAGFSQFDRGVSVTVKFDETTHPKQLAWIQTDQAADWLKILRIKTGIGSVVYQPLIAVEVAVVDSNGAATAVAMKGIKYLMLHEQAPKTKSIRAIAQIETELFQKNGAGFKHPDKVSNLDFVHDSWSGAELDALVGASLTAEEKEVFARHKPSISVEFGYTAKQWSVFNDSLGLRKGYTVANAGIQLAANDMPQGEVIQIPLKRNIGRQNQIHFLVHFAEYTPDLGRKGFHRELVDLAKTISKHITDAVLNKHRQRLKANTGISPDLLRENQIDAWKTEMIAHEKDAPLLINNPNFFLPTARIGITSVPTREQDVIALFNQLIAGGVIRGIKIMSTNERLTYDGMYRISFESARSIYEYHANTNPLGVRMDEDSWAKVDALLTAPKVMEYKFGLDGLIEDIDNNDKSDKDIGLVIVWRTGDMYKQKYGMTSLLIDENIDQRPFHGATHVLTDVDSNARVMDVIVLEELVQLLNDPVATAEAQRKKYE